MKFVQGVTAVLALAIISSAFILPQESKRLIKFSENEPAQWLTSAEIEKIIIEDKGFMDITDHQEENLAIKAPSSAVGKLERKIYIITSGFKKCSIVNHFVITHFIELQPFRLNSNSSLPSGLSSSISPFHA